jgi:predicted nucleotidyltransferase
VNIRGFFQILKTLNEHDVRYVLIGGLAAILWGSDQITLDVDVCYARDEENLRALVKALHLLDAHLRGWPKGVPEFIDERAFRLGDTMTFETKFGDFDCLGTPSGTDGYSELKSNAKEMKVEDDVTVFVASIDDIIHMKRTAGRAKDLSGVESLKVLREMRKDLETNDETPPDKS